ncbi:hypothetical protein TRICI_003131 [Trichomonascus ciferrii]|uniref:RNase III domain-containing protein n=1 Tax=Trichomonascus ciferrii TaxID=44093 RepID=A0A642V502_9ASCO|nr:hypothetical protein TRICI_003131 [Trichomonascus ciferrii]
MPIVRTLLKRPIISCLRPVGEPRYLTLATPSHNSLDWISEARKHGRYQNQFKRLAKVRNRTDSDSLVNSLLGTEYVIPKYEELEIMSPRLRNFPHKRDQYWSLATLGSGLLRIQCNVFTISAGYKGIIPVNGLYFENLVDQENTLTTLNVLRTFVREHGLSSAIVADPSDSISQNQELHAIDSLFMLIGSVYKHHGTSKAEDFLQERIINGINGLSHINMKLNSDWV